MDDWLPVAAAAIVLLFVSYALHERQECAARHGVLVRSIFGSECVQPAH